MDYLNLTETETEIAVIAEKQLEKVLLPVPFFILSIKREQKLNRNILFKIVDLMQNDKAILETFNISKERLKLILFLSADLVLLKRRFAMYAQFCLQLLVFFLLFKLLFWRFLF